MRSRRRKRRVLARFCVIRRGGGGGGEEKRWRRRGNEKGGEGGGGVKEDEQEESQPLDIDPTATRGRRGWVSFLHCKKGDGVLYFLCKMRRTPEIGRSWSSFLACVRSWWLFPLEIWIFFSISFFLFFFREMERFRFHRISCRHGPVNHWKF